MATDDENVARFTITVTGETTDKVYVGEFATKRALSYGDELARDRHRRDLRGGEPGSQDLMADDITYLFSELWPRLVEAPTWWKEKGNGIALVDKNVAPVVLNKAMEFDYNAIKARKKEAEAARLKLKEEADKRAAEEAKLDKEEAQAQEAPKV